jgi:hypothetical protein
MIDWEMKMNIYNLEENIDKAISKVKENGWSIQPQMWISCKDKCCCPLGAIVLSVDSHNPALITSAELVACITGLFLDEVVSFADGYDSLPFDGKKHLHEFWQLGKKYSEAYPLYDEYGDKYETFA